MWQIIKSNNKLHYITHSLHTNIEGLIMPKYTLYNYIQYYPNKSKCKVIKDVPWPQIKTTQAALLLPFSDEQ